MARRPVGVPAVLLLVVPVVSAGLAAAQWPQFRGPTGQGTTSEADLPVSWGGAAGENVLWSAPLRGEGHALGAFGEGRLRQGWSGAEEYGQEYG